ncbi:MAG: 1,4-dihydroxy-2-naphthoate polyprenyltransferase [Microbacteriaceae bacterium]|jgi:1,4-dihydroxy-2-naphthoate octaprenyltransferase|nr:1,4-dihydroxy-2-naphthoate polyprenyltransferase [Microbacteriaceae bacterium]MCI1206865.1 1,4-dihydroxy-2-naphthoate polyprenyltransferase [Microbacteriaceae bacterium]
MTQANSLARRATPADWIEGARLRTLPLSVAPVVLGTGLAAAAGQVAWGRALLCLWVALWLQIGVNYANDYSDGIRGTDGEDRVGPARLTGGRLARPSTVRAVAFSCFGLAALGGLLLVALCGQWWLLLIGCAAVAAAWFYTGGRHPYGYAGLGELFVFVFFGLVATVGTVFVQTLRVQVLDWIAAVAMGLFACAVLMVNNLRDIETDPRQGKHTLAVRLGRVRAERAFAGLVLVPVLLLIPMSLLHPAAVLGLLCLPLAELALRDGLFPRTARDRIAALRWTSLSALLFALAAAVGLWI